MKTCESCTWWKGSYVNLDLQKKCHSVLKGRSLKPDQRPAFTKNSDGHDCKFYSEISQ